MINFKHTLMLRLLIRTIWFQLQFSLDGKRRVINGVGKKITLSFDFYWIISSVTIATQSPNPNPSLI